MLYASASLPLGLYKSLTLCLSDSLPFSLYASQPVCFSAPPPICLSPPVSTLFHRVVLGQRPRDHVARLLLGGQNRTLRCACT